MVEVNKIIFNYIVNTIIIIIIIALDNAPYKMLHNNIQLDREYFLIKS